MRVTLFRLGLAATLVAISISAWTAGIAQAGPPWEVPVHVVELLRRAESRALAAALAGLLALFLGRGFPWARRRARIGYAVLTVIALAGVAVLGSVDVAQWPASRPLLSRLARGLAAPTLAASLGLFWLVGYRWTRDAA